MASGKDRTKKSRSLGEDLDAEDLANKRWIFGDTEAEDTKSGGASDNEDSAGAQDDKDIYMKKQVYGTVYDRTPAKRGRWEPQDPSYMAKRTSRDLCTNKGDGSSNKEDQSKSKDAGYDAPDPNNSGDDRYNDSSKDEEEKSTNPDESWTFFQSV